MSADAAMLRLRETMLQAEHGGMSDELLASIEEIATELFTPDVVRLVQVLAADARYWRKVHSGEVSR